jgi:hypothetical protein
MTQPQEESFQPVKRKRGGEWDHGNHSTLGKIKDSSTKINIILDIHKISCEDGILAHMMTETCRSFLKETATPIVKCIKNYFKSNVNAFVAKYATNGKFTHCKFHKKCSGISESCGKY